ncbi:MAG: hypothetical protein Q4B68_10780 [Bacteroidales bacterium]|nr:hypothetical protein [Bacteroidales bacterium]
MNNLSEEKLAWLQVRRSTITDYYTVPAAMQPQVDAVFADMAAIAHRCADQGEFERELLASPVNAAYTGLFTALASHVKGVDAPSAADQKKHIAASTAKSVVKSQVRNGIIGWLVNILPSWITDWWVYREYNIPGVREVKSAINTHEQFSGRIRRAYEGDKEQKQLEKEIEEQNKKIEQEKAEAARKVEEMRQKAQEEQQKFQQ